MKPTREICQQQLETAKCVPLFKTIPADCYTPILLLKKLKQQGKQCFLLESVSTNATWSRYSFLGCSPLFTIRLVDGQVEKDTLGVCEKMNGSINDVISDILSQYTVPTEVDKALPPFTGGFVGNFAYEYAMANFNLAVPACDAKQLADVELMFFDTILAFDHYTQELFLITHIHPQTNKTYENCCDVLEKLEQIVCSTAPEKTYPSKQLSPITQQFEQAEFETLVTDAKAHIIAGDIFQIVLSNRFHVKFSGDLLSTYRVLRMTNPSPYMFYLDFNSHQITGASPETLVSLRDNHLSTFPIAGTCPRGQTPEEDRELVAAMLSNQKELAEHNMLVDLSRNDIGKISQFGTVEVSEYQKVMQFSHVSHITSTVRGVLNREYSQMDVIDAITPAGTLSGAPKKRAMELIAAFEKTPRGVYGGAIGYIALNGAIDCAIAIRLAVKIDNDVTVSAGAGIVLDSDPTSEYNECRHKANAMLNALSQAEGVE